MNRTTGLVIILILLALVIPAVSAETVWNRATPVYIEPALLTSEDSGTLDISVRCEHSLFSEDVIVHNDDLNTENLIFLAPNGHFFSRFIPGNYTAILIDGNGAHAEIQHARVNAGYNTIIRFIGHAVTHPRLLETPVVVSPTPTPIPVPPDTCYPVQFDYIETGAGVPMQEITYRFINTNRDQKTVYVYIWEDYRICEGMTTRALMDYTGSFAAAPGITEVVMVLPYNRGHISYRFEIETICEEIK